MSKILTKEDVLKLKKIWDNLNTAIDEGCWYLGLEGEEYGKDEFEEISSQLYNYLENLGAFSSKNKIKNLSKKQIKIYDKQTRSK